MPARYVHGSNAATDDPLMAFTGSTVSSSSRHWLHADHLGSIIATTDGSGANPAINTYDEYGIPGSANSGRFGYTGQTWLYEIGLDYYKARIYSPTLGRFLQTDPVGYKDQINLYGYVGDDPVNSTDSTGEVIDTILDVGFVAYDVYRLATEGATAENVAALGADAVATIVPGVTGAGVAVRTAEHASEIGRSSARSAETAKDSRFFSKADRANLHNRADGKCEYCGRKLTNEPGKANSMHADHAQAHSKGGKTALDNGVAACRGCNLSKGAKDLSGKPGQDKFVPQNPNRRIQEQLSGDD
jgi:RHS repeat-associated protein